jgi:hypothetical protein
VDIPKGVNLPKLVRLVATELKLVPDGISEAAKGANIIGGILTNLAVLTQGLAELRGCMARAMDEMANTGGLHRAMRGSQLRPLSPSSTL